MSSTGTTTLRGSFKLLSFVHKSVSFLPVQKSKKNGK